MILKPASEVRASIERNKVERRQSSIDKQLTTLAQQIDAQKVAGHIDCLTVMPEVEQKLLEMGYTIKHNKAWHMGDMDSITISW